MQTSHECSRECFSSSRVPDTCLKLTPSFLERLLPRIRAREACAALSVTGGFTLFVLRHRFQGEVLDVHRQIVW